MPFYDLNVVYTNNHSDLNHTLLFHQELGYSTVAITISITGKLPPTPPTIPVSTITTDSNLRLTLLTRLNLTIADATQNHRLSSLQPHYNILALRPTTEKTLQLCCSSLDCDLISLDFTHRLPFLLKFPTVASALQRGVRFEICYSAGVGGSPGQGGVSASEARRNLISGAASLVRATRGRGIIISSEARTALGVRGPWDIINLAQLWGLSRERAKEAICEETGKVVRLAAIRRSSYRGVVDVIQPDRVGVGVGATGVKDTAALHNKGKQQQHHEPRNAHNQPRENLSLKRKLSTKSRTGNNNGATTDQEAAWNVMTTTTTNPSDPKTLESAASIPLHETKQNVPAKDKNSSTSESVLSNREKKRRAKKTRLLNGGGDP